MTMVFPLRSSGHHFITFQRTKLEVSDDYVLQFGMLEADV